MEKIKVLLYLSNSKFSEIDYISNEFSKLEKKFKIIIHDLSAVLGSEIHNKSFNVNFYKKNYKRFDSIKLWKLALKDLKKKYNIIVFKNIAFDNFNSILISLILKRFNFPIIYNPSPECLEYPLKKNIDYYIYRLKILSFSLIFYYIRSKLYLFLSSFIKFNLLFILKCGTFNNYNILTAKKKIIVNFHSKNYSNSLDFIIKKMKNDKKNEIIFIDGAGPYFFDDYNILGKKISFNIPEWYSDINLFLKNLEKKFSSKVIVIHHPKNRKLKNPFLNESHGFIFDRTTDATLKRILNCSFVVSYNYNSTAIAYAIAFNKPWLFAYSNQIHKDLRIKTNMFDLARATGSKVLNTNRPHFSFNQLKINNYKYKSYKFKYLTSKFIKNVPNYKILEKIIKNCY